MPSTIENCDTFDPSVRERLNALVAEYRPDIEECGARIGLMFQFAAKPGRAAMKHRGQGVAGSCRVNNYQDRVEGKPDATIMLDGDLWAKLPERKRLALLHHELEHIAIWGGKCDLAGRPILRGRFGDWEFDGFHSILKIYGRESFEHGHLARIAEHHRQMTFSFGPEPTAADVSSELGQWRDYEIARQLIAEPTDAITSSLRAHGIVTTGHLHDYLARGKELSDIPGLDAEKADRLAEVIDAMALRMGGDLREKFTPEFLGFVVPAPSEAKPKKPEKRPAAAMQASA